MKIAVFTDTYEPQVNGVVSVLESILPRLAKGNEVILFAPGNGSKMRMEQKGGITIYWAPASPFPFYEGYLMSAVAPREIDRVLKKEKPDIVHAHAPVLLGLQGILVAKRKKIPIVATYHTHFPDYLPYLLDGKLPGFLSPISTKTVEGLIRLVFSLADVSTAPTQELVNELKSYGVKNAVVLANGVDLSSMKADAKLCEEFREKNNIPEGKKIILYVGRVGFEKRLNVLLDAVEKMESKDFVLVVVGSGPQMENYLQYASSLGLKGVIFTGFVDKKTLPAAYASAHVFASASDSETFGLTFIEAMALGVPVIGVNRLGPKELIKDGKNGFLVEPGDSSTMAKRLDQLLSDNALRKRMSASAREMAEKFSIERSVEETLSIYRKLVKK